MLDAKQLKEVEVIKREICSRPKFFRKLMVQLYKTNGYLELVPEAGIQKKTMQLWLDELDPFDETPKELHVFFGEGWNKAPFDIPLSLFPPKVKKQHLQALKKLKSPIVDYVYSQMTIPKQKLNLLYRWVSEPWHRAFSTGNDPTPEDDKQVDRRMADIFGLTIREFNKIDPWVTDQMS